MKHLLCLFVPLIATCAFAQQDDTSLDNFRKNLDTPALRQFQEQASCTTEKAVGMLDGDVLTQSVLLRAAESCVPLSFKPEMAGLPAGMRPATREERIQSLAVASSRRISICAKMGLVGPGHSAECSKLFQAANSLKVD